MPLRLFNTRTHAVEELTPLQPGRVGIYVCGLTPSADAHLGHARSFLFFDVLRRYLEHPRNGFRVTYVQNVTDIDDRSIATAQREGTSYDAVVARFYGAFKESMRVLGVREPDREPYATHYIAPIVAMIGELIAGGFAYATGDGVYYAVESFPRYGALSGKNVDELLVGARIAENESKRDPLDFALWKFAKPGEPQWDAPWGSGRPGWHIECSAMSRELLGVPFDLHGGGYDLIFPHHENEIAQSEALMAHPPMANTWVHGGLLNFEGRKMSKSLGNFEPLTDLLRRHDPLAIRLLFLQTGYRKPMNFTEESVGAARAALDKIAGAFKRAEAGTATPPSDRRPVEPAAHRAALFEHLDEDMNTAGALGVVHDLAGDLARYGDARMRDQGLALVREAFAIFGIEAALDRERAVQFDATFAERLRARLGDAVRPDGTSPEAAIEAAIAARAAARAAKDFALGDRLRDALAAEGVLLKDSKDGTTWIAAG